MTEFQKKVLDAVKKVPEGRVASYSEIAEYIGSPNASRAVGGALGSNPKPIIVPCHRIVCKNGLIGGYLMGTKEKARLLGKEGIKTENGRICMKKFGFKLFSEKS